MARPGHRMDGMLIEVVALGTLAACWGILILSAWLASRGKL